MIKVRRTLFRSSCLLALLAGVLPVGGCGALSSTISESPSNWDDYADRTVTVQGSAGNSNQGPIVRLTDGGYIALLTREPWGLDERGYLIAGRPVEVKGQVVHVEGFRAEKYVLKVESVTVLPPGPPTSRTPVQ